MDKFVSKLLTNLGALYGIAKWPYTRRLKVRLLGIRSSPRSCAGSPSCHSSAGGPRVPLHASSARTHRTAHGAGEPALILAWRTVPVKKGEVTPPGLCPQRSCQTIYLPPPILLLEFSCGLPMQTGSVFLLLSALAKAFSFWPQGWPKHIFSDEGVYP